MGLRLVVSVSLGLGWVVAHAGAAEAATLTVTSAADDGGIGTLRDAITAVNQTPGTASVIRFDPSLDGQTITLLTALPQVIAPLTLSGLGADQLTIENAAGVTDVPVLSFGHIKVTISGVTIQGGTNASGLGGGIAVAAGGGLTLLDSVITGNSAEFGSAIYTAGTSLLIQRTTISGNSGDGAIYIATSAGPTLVDSTIAGNHGTAIVFDPASDDVELTIARCTVSGNSAPGEIGGLQLRGGSATVTNSTFSGNTGDMGADFWTFSPGVALNLLNVTAVSDTSPSLRIDVDATVNLRNTVFAGTGARCLGAPTSLGHNLATDATCDLISPSDHESVDPRLGPLADNGGFTQTHALLAGSPALDAADATGLDDTDQRGDPRVQFAAVDIGALEVTESKITQQPTAQLVTAGHALTLTVAAHNQNSSSPLTYQWRKDGAAITGATGSTFTKSAEFGDAGSYDVLVINDGGSVASTAVAVTVDDEPATPVDPGTKDGGGCCSTSGAGAASSGLLAVMVAAALGRRRRPRRAVDLPDHPGA